MPRNPNYFPNSLGHDVLIRQSLSVIPMYVKLMEFRFLLQANEVVMETSLEPGLDPRRRLSKNQANRHQNNNKKWPLLVRSLSDSAKYRNSRSGNPASLSGNAYINLTNKSSTNSENIKTETKALTLSLSDSRLFSKTKKSSGVHQFDEFFVQTLTGMDRNDPETCSCGCDDTADDADDCRLDDCEQVLAGNNFELNLAGNFEFLDEEDSNEEDEEADYSEDEGCFVITSVPQSNEETEPEEEGEEQEVTNKVRH